MAPWNWFKPSSKIFYWPFQGGTSFVDFLCFCSVLCLLCFVRVCLYVLCGHLLGKGWPLGSRLWCLLWVCHFPIGILGQVWYLIVSIPDLCNLITLILSIISLGVQMYNSVLSWYLTSLPKSGYKTQLFVKKWYCPLPYDWICVFAGVCKKSRKKKKKVEAWFCHILLGVKMYSVIPRYQISLRKTPPKSSYKGYNVGVN